jgi:predicted RNA binding protein YcfA (HicA-like mRNA interferase family)
MGINDTIKLSKFIRVLKHYGFYKCSQKGSHIKFKHPGVPRPLIIPAHSKEIPFYVAKELMKTISITQSELEKLLKEI